MFLLDHSLASLTGKTYIFQGIGVVAELCRGENDPVVVDSNPGR